MGALRPILSNEDTHSRSVLETYVEKKKNSASITLTIWSASHADSCQKHHIIPLNSLYSGLEGTSIWYRTYLPQFQLNKLSPKHSGAQNKKKTVPQNGFPWNWKIDFLCEKNQILSQFQNFACTLHAFFRGQIWMKRMFLEFWFLHFLCKFVFFCKHGSNAIN